MKFLKIMNVTVVHAFPIFKQDFLTIIIRDSDLPDDKLYEKIRSIESFEDAPIFSDDKPILIFENSDYYELFNNILDSNICESIQFFIDEVGIISIYDTLTLTNNLEKLVGVKKELIISKKYKDIINKYNYNDFKERNDNIKDKVKNKDIPKVKTKTQQCKFYDKDNNLFHGGILLTSGDILCGCCGGLIPADEIGPEKDKGFVIIEIFEDWVNIGDDIIGD